MTHIDAPMFVTVADDRLRMPANIDSIWTMRNTANVRPTSSVANFVRSLTSSL